MPTTVVSTIGSTGDYATIALWEAACPANLVTADQIWEGQLQNQEFVETVAISGMTTDATRYVHLTTVAGASFANNANKLTNALKYNASNGAAVRYASGDTITGSVTYLKLSKLQIKSSARCLNLSGNATVDQCILDAQIHFAQITGSGPIIMRNVLGIMTIAGGSFGCYIPFGASSYLNCAFIRPSNYAASQTALVCDGGGSIIIKNTSVFGFSTFRSGSSPTANNNASDLATVPGTSAQASLTFADQFEQASNASALDLRTKAGSAQLLNGADLSASGVTTDIVGSARTVPYNIGVWQPAAAGGFSPQAVWIF